jgi:hypothetical protein
MALTPAETQKRYRERLKKKEKQANVATFKLFRSPFFEFFNKQSSSFGECLAIAGVDEIFFEDDSGPRSFGKNGVFDLVEDELHLEESVGSLGRAELVISALLDAAGELAAAVKEYKRTEIKARLAEIEALDLSDAHSKKAALHEAAKLHKMLDQLDKQVRWTIPQWKVTG